MDFYWIKTNRLIKQLFSKQIWDLPNTEKKVYLTFDDGPTPEVTEWVLSLLKAHNIKATFFCIGDNIRKYPEIFKQVIAEGHRIGNHTYNHLQGWKTSNKKYLENISACEKAMQQSEYNNTQTKLFRPPYGKIGPIQDVKLRKLGYKIIMWDVLSADFDFRITPEECLKNVVSNTTQGSIIVFHDSRKAFKNLEYTLPETIAILKEKGFVFDTID